MDITLQSLWTTYLQRADQFWGLSAEHLGISCLPHFPCNLSCHSFRYFGNEMALHTGSVFGVC
jgi:hypothetical protein